MTVPAGEVLENEEGYVVAVGWVLTLLLLLLLLETWKTVTAERENARRLYTTHYFNRSLDTESTEWITTLLRTHRPAAEVTGVMQQRLVTGRRPYDLPNTLVYGFATDRLAGLPVCAYLLDAAAAVADVQLLHTDCLPQTDKFEHKNKWTATEITVANMTEKSLTTPESPAPLLLTCQQQKQHTRTGDFL